MFASLQDHALEALERARSEIAVCGVPQTRRVNIGWAHFVEDGEAWLDLMTELDRCGCTGPALYVFSLVDPKRVTEVAAAFTAKKKVIERLPRDHRKPSPVLYVGSSRSLASRLKDHFGFGHPSTYGLKLPEWLPDEVELTLEFACYGEDTSPTTIAALEEALWDRSKPMFGRKGAR